MFTIKWLSYILLMDKETYYLSLMDMGSKSTQTLLYLKWPKFIAIYIFDTILK